MSFESNDLLTNKENEKENNINVNLSNRKYHLIKIKQQYLELLEQLKEKIKAKKNIENQINKNSCTNKKIEEIKNKINKYEISNKILEEKNLQINKENEKLTKFFNDFFQNTQNNIPVKTKINIVEDQNLIDIFKIEENNKIFAYKKNKLFD